MGTFLLVAQILASDLGTAVTRVLLVVAVLVGVLVFGAWVAFNWPSWSENSEPHSLLAIHGYLSNGVTAGFMVSAVLPSDAKLIGFAASVIVVVVAAVVVEERRRRRAMQTGIGYDIVATMTFLCGSWTAGAIAGAILPFVGFIDGLLGGLLIAISAMLPSSKATYRSEGA